MQVFEVWEGILVFIFRLGGISVFIPNLIGNGQWYRSCKF